MDILKDLFGSVAFYAALIALLNALQRYLRPELPPEISISANAFLVVVFGVIAARVAMQKYQARAARAQVGGTYGTH